MRNDGIAKDRDDRPESALFFSDRDCSVYDKENWMCVTVGNKLIIRMVEGNLMIDISYDRYFKRIK